VGWFEGTEKEISKKLGKDFHAVRFGKSGVATIGLSGGRTATIRADSQFAEITKSLAPTRGQGYINAALANEIARRVEPIPKATAAFAGISVAAGLAIGTTPALAEAAFATGEGQAAFWSGSAEAQAAAMESAGTTIEQTIGGRILSATNFLTKPISPLNRLLWNNASRYFAQGASGEANVFLNTTINPAGTWSAIEQPILQRNGVSIVTHILRP
jgi:hypothetical protein